VPAVGRVVELPVRIALDGAYHAESIVEVTIRVKAQLVTSINRLISLWNSTDSTSQLKDFADVAVLQLALGFFASDQRLDQATASGLLSCWSA
ncbi:MAG TPA: hypothetical protein VGG33_06990, partial [Polyangia bacterium]